MLRRATRAWVVLCALGAGVLVLEVSVQAAAAPQSADQPAEVETEIETEDDLAFLEELAKDYRRGGSHAARRELQEYLLDYPRSPQARRLAAEAALARGEIEEAEEHLSFVDGGLPALRSRLLLRQGHYEEALELALGGELAPVAAGRLEVSALDGLGHRRDALRRSAEVTSAIDDRELDGLGLVDLAWLYFFQRKFELANQALVFADAELNGRRGPSYRLNDASVIVLLGEVYHATRQSGQGGLDKTLSALNEVLAIDPGQADALTVKAKVYRYGGNGRKANEALDRALSRDPGHPDALVARAEMMLQSRRVEDAFEVAERILEDNPRHRGGLALRATALAVGRDAEAAAEARERFVALQPESAALDALLGRVLQEHYRFGESVAPLERALQIEPVNEDPLSILAQSLAHLGREKEARAALEEHRASSPYPYPWRENMLEVLGRLERTAELDTGDGFLLRLPPSEREVLGVLLPDRLRASREELTERWKFEPDEDVLVEVFDVHADFSVRTVGFEGFFAVGACFGNVVTLVSPLSEMRGRFHWEQTALHEYAHVVTLGLSRQRIPRWLSEGVSVVEEHKAHPDWRRRLERDVLDARANDLVFPITRMDEAFQDGSTVMLGYYLGSLVCEVVEQDFGFDKLVEFVAAYADGSSTREAVRSALGIEPEQLDARLLAYIDTVIGGRAAIRPRFGSRGKESLRRRVLAGEQDALIDLAWAYHDLGQLVDRDSTLRRAKKRLGEGPRLTRLEAEIALTEGEVDAALAGLRAWAADEDAELEADGLSMLGRILLSRGEREEALDALRRSRALFPSDIEPGGALVLLYDELDPDVDEESEEWLDVLRDIRRFDDTAIEPRRRLAQEALDVDDLPAAAELYAEMIAIDPYDPESRMKLADLYARIGDLPSARRQWTFVLGTRADQLGSGSAGSSPFAELVKEDLGDMQETARRRLEETAGGQDSGEDLDAPAPDQKATGEG